VCEIYSRIGGVGLTDKDIIAHHENNNLGRIDWRQYTGHTGISNVFPKQTGCHEEGWDMPIKTKRLLLSGACDRIIKAGDNLEAAPEWALPILKRLKIKIKSLEHPLSGKRVWMKETDGAPAQWVTFLGRNPNTKKIFGVKLSNKRNGHNSEFDLRKKPLGIVSKKLYKIWKSADRSRLCWNVFLSRISRKRPKR
jgi:hypothetical protein